MISLVQTSQNRKEELRRFINSINNLIGPKFSDIQLIFIDQEDNEEIFKDLNPHILFTYIKYHRCSLSHARNIGLKHVKGEYVGFPDDDCWYEPDTLTKVLSYLKSGKYQGITGKGTNENGELTSSFPNTASELTVTKRCAAISYTIFFKFCPNLEFDEIMGVGSPYNIGSGEETDYLLTLMEKYNYKVYYDPNISIHHPTYSIYNKDVILKRTYSYARGAGYLIKKHSFSTCYILKQIIRPILGMLISFCKIDFFNCHKSFLNAKGRIEGYFFRTYNHDKTNR